MNRLRCGEVSCTHHQGGCQANCIMVRERFDLPSCYTFQTTNVEVLTAQEHMMGFDQGYIGDGVLSTKFANIELESKDNKYTGQINCTVSHCFHNKEYDCSAPWIEIGFPKEGEADTSCKTYIKT